MKYERRGGVVVLEESRGASFIGPRIDEQRVRRAGSKQTRTLLNFFGLKSAEGGTQFHEGSEKRVKPLSLHVPSDSVAPGGLHRPGGEYGGESWARGERGTRSPNVKSAPSLSAKTLPPGRSEISPGGITLLHLSCFCSRLA